MPVSHSATATSDGYSVLNLEFTRAVEIRAGDVTSGKAAKQGVTGWPAAINHSLSAGKRPPVKRRVFTK